MHGVKARLNAKQSKGYAFAELYLNNRGGRWGDMAMITRWGWVGIEQGGRGRAAGVIAMNKFGACGLIEERVLRNSNSISFQWLRGSVLHPESLWTMLIRGLSKSIRISCQNIPSLRPLSPQL